MTARDLWRVLPLLLVLGLSVAPAWGVPALSDETVVEGEVVEYAIVASSVLHIEPPTTLYRLQILPADPAGVPLKVLSREPLSARLFGRRVRAKVLCQGDEWGGRCWLRQIESLYSASPQD